LNEVSKLAPKTEAQRFLQTQAMDEITELGKIRLMLFTNAGGSIPIPFLIVLIGWLALIFASISLFAEDSTRAVAVLCIFPLLQALRFSLFLS
jgi:hypothetical protein